MTEIRKYVDGPKPDDEEPDNTDKKRRILFAAAQYGLDQRPADVAKRADCDNAYVSWVLKRADHELIEEYRKKLDIEEGEESDIEIPMESDGGTTMNIFVFGDVDPEELAELLRK